MFKKIVKTGLLFVATLLLSATGLGVRNHRAYAATSNLAVGSLTGGIVTSSPAGINCGLDDTHLDCGADFATGTVITLTFSGLPAGKYFDGFTLDTGPCSSTTSTSCTFTLNADTRFTTVIKSNPTVNIFGVNSSAGNVTVSGGGTCSTSFCQYSFSPGTGVTVTANTTGADYKFWSMSNCATSTCSFTIDKTDRSFTPEWILKTTSFTAGVRGSGSGTITSSKGGMNCTSSSCSISLSSDKSAISFTATPNAGSTFAGWARQDEGGQACVYWSGKGGDGGDITKRVPDTTCQTSTLSGGSFNLYAYFESAGGTATPANTQSTGTTTNGQNQNKVATTAAINTDEAASIGIKDLVLQTSDGKNAKDVDGFENGQPIVIQGKADPNATVHLFIFSSPHEATVIADANGNWSYTMTGLEPGNHHVEAEVTPAGSSTPGKRVTVASFSVLKEGQKSQAVTTTNSARTLNPPQKKTSSTPLLAAAGVGIVLISAVIYLVKFRHLKLLFWKH